MSRTRRRDDPWHAALNLWSLAVDAWAAFWLSLLEPHVNDPDEVPRSVNDVADRSSAPLSDATRDGMLVPVMFRKDADADVETMTNDTSFLAQLEQRTQQVKITLANLEAERTRIEDLIARLQPLVPHYDALLDAERSITDANIALEEARGETSSPAEPSAPPSWEEQHQPSSETGWNG